MSGQNARRLFVIKDKSDVTFIGVGFKDGYVQAPAGWNKRGEGGCVWMHDSRVKIEGSTFTHCRATNGAGGYHNYHNNKGYGGGIYAVGSEAVLALSGVQFSSGSAQVGGDVYKHTSSVTLTCAAACPQAGMFMANLACTNPTAVSTSGGTCLPYCSSHASDCAICELLGGSVRSLSALSARGSVPAFVLQHHYSSHSPGGKNTYNADLNETAACSPCPAGSTIADAGTDVYLHDEASDCQWLVGRERTVRSGGGVVYCPLA